uniref:Uncharacterized protein n=1 Tax=Triticum urartu TaxID=4572 RepID=A0A8R7RDD6_TRIUA
MTWLLPDTVLLLPVTILFLPDTVLLLPFTTWLVSLTTLLLPDTTWLLPVRTLLLPDTTVLLVPDRVLLFPDMTVLLSPDRTLPPPDLTVLLLPDKTFGCCWSTLLLRFTYCARPSREAPGMGPVRPYLGSRSTVTRPLLLSQPTPSQPQHEAPDHSARRRTPPPPRFLAKPRNARRSLGWHDLAC